MWEKTPEYDAFRRRVVSEVADFRRDHDGGHMDEVGRILAELGGPDAPTTESPRQRIRFDGWVSLPFRISRSGLARLNPDYDVIVRRYARDGLGRRGKLLRFGFRITGIGDADLPPFRLRAQDLRGNEIFLRRSNGAVIFKQSRLEGDDAPEVASTSIASGFLDDLWITPDRDDGDLTTWLPALVHDRPAELHDFALSGPGNAYACVFADLVKRFPVNARWADRFELTARGLEGPFASDLRPLRVERPNPVSSVPGPGSVVRPVPEREGALVGFRPGPALPIPDNRWLTIDDARVQNGGVVTRDGSLVTYEGSADPVHDFVAGQWMSVFGSPAHPEGALVLEKPDSGARHPEGILISGRNDENWFHWLVEYLPRVLTIPSDIPADAPLIVTTRTPPTGIEALRELTARPLLTIDPEVTVSFGRLHLTAPPMQVLDTTRVPWIDGVSVDRRPLDALRAAWGVDSPATGAGRRIFVERNSRHRGLTNEHQLAEIAKRRGFEILDPAALSFAGQRELFSSTDVLVGASGAVMSNYLMMRPGSRILAMTSDQLHDFVLPAVVATIAGCTFTYVTGPSRATLAASDDRNRWIHADFRVSPEDFRRALDAVVDAGI